MICIYSSHITKLHYTSLVLELLISELNTEPIYLVFDIVTTSHKLCVIVNKNANKAEAVSSTEM